MHQLLVNPDFVKTWISLVHIYFKTVFPHLNTNDFCEAFTKPLLHTKMTFIILVKHQVLTQTVKGTTRT